MFIKIQESQKPAKKVLKLMFINWLIIVVENYKFQSGKQFNEC